MPERSGQRPTRTRQQGPRRTSRQTRTAPSRNGRGPGLRDRLRRDPFLFVLCLGALAFITWAFALTWWVTGGLIPLALALASVAPAFFLFYLRDAR
jgi:Flp pilus assembly protein TadB